MWTMLLLFNVCWRDLGRPDSRYILRSLHELMAER